MEATVDVYDEEDRITEIAIRCLFCRTHAEFYTRIDESGVELMLNFVEGEHTYVAREIVPFGANWSRINHACIRLSDSIIRMTAKIRSQTRKHGDDS